MGRRAERTSGLCRGGVGSLQGFKGGDQLARSQCVPIKPLCQVLGNRQNIGGGARGHVVSLRWWKMLFSVA